MHQYCIDFVAGSHGNFLEYACNKYIAEQSLDFSPFTPLGASHVKPQEYIKHRQFVAHHFFQKISPYELTKNIIRISFSHDDLLLLSSVCFLRAGDANIDSDLLEHNTWSKLHGSWHHSLINSINHAYSFVNLSSQQPDCPRYVLREFFKFGFKEPGSHGLIQSLGKMVYLPDHRTFDFPFNCFYNTQSFCGKMQDLATWCEKTIKNIDNLAMLHEEFLNRQIYRADKIQADYIIDAVINGRSMPISRLRLLQESYINGTLERLYSKEMPFHQETYFSNTLDILNHLGSA